MGRWVEDDDDIHLGNIEIGESLRGMQHTDITNMGAAQRQLAQLRGALGQVAAQRFNPHAPLQKTIRSPYKDSTQIGISCVGTFTPANWTGATALPQVSGNSRVYQSFKPVKVIVTEVLTVTFSTSTLGASTVVAMVRSADDVVLVSAFAGAQNCFPNAPNQDNGIPGPAFANNSLGNGISWPTLNGGIDMVVAFAIEQSAVYQATPPAGYTSANITTIGVKIRFALFGPSLR